MTFPSVTVSLLALTLFNILDAVLTLTMVTLGANEVNPLMAVFVMVWPTIFVVGKLLGVALFACLLAYAGAKRSLALLAAVYGVVVLLESGALVAFPVR